MIANRIFRSLAVASFAASALVLPVSYASGAPADSCAQINNATTTASKVTRSGDCTVQTRAVAQCQVQVSGGGTQTTTSYGAYVINGTSTAGCIQLAIKWGSQRVNQAVVWYQ